MTALITFTLLPTTVHLGLMVWWLNHPTQPTVLGELALQLCLLGTRSAIGTGLLMLMAVLYLAILRQFQRAPNLNPWFALMLGLLYPVPLMTAITLTALLNQII